jgi:hypothetical protein
LWNGSTDRTRRSPTMPARRKSTPSNLLHKQSGRARAVWTDAAGIRRERLLPGPFESEASRAAFGRLLLELANPPASVPARAGISVNALLLAYYGHAERYYVDAAGKPTKELRNMKDATKPVREPPATTTRMLHALRDRSRGRDRSREGWREALVPVSASPLLRDPRPGRVRIRRSTGRPRPCSRRRDPTVRSALLYSYGSALKTSHFTAS